MNVSNTLMSVRVTNVKTRARELPLVRAEVTTARGNLINNTPRDLRVIDMTNRINVAKQMLSDTGVDSSKAEFVYNQPLNKYASIVIFSVSA